MQLLNNAIIKLVRTFYYFHAISNMSQKLPAKRIECFPKELDIFLRVFRASSAFCTSRDIRSIETCIFTKVDILSKDCGQRNTTMIQDISFC